MTAQVPAALRSADIYRFALRASQLEKARPVITYWCEYWIVNQILSKGLHNTDQECLVYTTNLMDKLEQFKAANADNETVMDDTAGKAYVQTFALETFQRADNAVRANKASRQTADTFQASATFLDLLQIWGSLDPESAIKTKYAKYHALRIAKAIKAGEDPDESNPKPEPEPESSEDTAAFDTDEADVHGSETGQSKARQPSVVEVPDEADRITRGLAQRSSLDQSLHPSRETSMPPLPNPQAHQPSVIEVQDDADKFASNLARQSSIDQSLHPSRAPSAPPHHDVSPIAQDPSSYYTQSNEPVSPMASAEERKPSVGANYFPQVPPAVEEASPQSAAPLNDHTMFGLPIAPLDPALPQVPISFHQPPPPLDTRIPPDQPVRQSPPPPSRHHGNFLPQGSPNAAIPPNLAPPQAPRQPIFKAPPQLQQRPAVPPQPRPPVPMLPVHAAIPPQPQAAAVIPNVDVDEAAMMKAQKHARWAISALDFEDVPTAIRELRGALAQLGAP